MSNISKRRAEKMKDENHEEMLDKVDAMYLKYYTSGRMKTRYPESNQVSDFDEMGGRVRSE